MNILIVAYEFPPSRSPQAVRWHELSHQLAALGHRVTVLSASESTMLVGAASVGELRRAHGTSVDVVRTSAVTGSRLLWWVRNIVGKNRTGGAVVVPRGFHGLNWKGRIVAVWGWMQAWASFPDVRANWNLTAGPALKDLIATCRPDVVITSHEPASVLELGCFAQEAGIPWVADLGDPIVADYLPARWHRRARRLERLVCERCSLVAVTAQTYADRLHTEYGLEQSRCIVLRQGFPPAADVAPTRSYFGGGTLELLYTGQLYSFRSVEPLLEALATLDGVRLTVLSPQAQRVEPHVERLGSRLRLVPPVPRDVVRQWQRGADILVNIGNTMPLQVPGKLFEYFGSGRPVLHLSACEPDESTDLVRVFRRGWTVENAADPIRAKLLELGALWRRGSLHAGLDLSSRSVGEFSWPMIGEQLSDALSEAVERQTRQIQA
ncbi:glycosyltransferase [Lysobacter zhanggongensis]|uniref:Glycosyltransferase n=1 Tax=Lysobacter zhanggongensis TaxID=1774951 RepID=A0ABU7YNW5_9GAMM